MPRCHAMPCHAMPCHAMPRATIEKIGETRTLTVVVLVARYSTLRPATRGVQMRYITAAGSKKGSVEQCIYHRKSLFSTGGVNPSMVKVGVIILSCMPVFRFLNFRRRVPKIRNNYRNMSFHATSAGSVDARDVARR
jgi:hypothetical protein